jgi:uncharacterized RDD family membrane protein YckC
MQTKATPALRIAATLLDLALFVPIYFAAVFALTKLLGKPGDRMWDLNPVRLSATAGNLLWLAYSSLEWLAARTPGKLLLRLKITAEDGSPAPRGQLVLRWAAKQSPRMLGLLDAITVTWALRMLIAKGGLAFFYHEPMNFKLARDLGELLMLILLAGFLLTLRPRRQALHDLLTNTAVYHRRPALPTRGFEPVTPEPRPVMVQSLESREMI